jgi:peptide/nickel transport system substrate-binding protein
MQRPRGLSTLGAVALLVVTACSPAAQPSPSASARPSSAPPQSASASTSPSAVTGGTLTVHLYQAFTSFYPWSESGTGGDSLSMELQWDFLAAYDEKGQPEMRLADSIEPSADAKTWTIKLKPGLKWSDGTPFTSADVLFSWKENANPNHSYNWGLWSNVVGATEWQKAGDFSKDIPGITAPDDNTVVFTLKEPNAAFLATLLNFRNYILPSKAVLAAAPNIAELKKKEVWALPYWQSPTVGIGPYLWSKTETGQFLSFKPNPNWRGNPAKFDEVIVKPIADFAVAAAQLQSGDLDLAIVTLDDLDGLAAAGLQTGTGVAPFPIQSDMNNSKASRFQDPKVRQAFMYGCDRQGFVDSFLKGKGQKVDSYFFPDWVPKDGITVYNYDPAKAKSLLDEAKFDYSKPVQWLSWNKDARDRQSFLEDCQAKMKDIGVQITIVNGLDVTNKKTADGDWDLALYGGYPIADPDQIRQFTSCSAIGSVVKPNGFRWNGANYTNYCDKKFDDLMDQGSKVADQAQRATIYKQAQDIFLSDIPIMINYINATAYAYSAKLQGVTIYGDPSQAFLKIDQWSKTP